MSDGRANAIFSLNAKVWGGSDVEQRQWEKEAWQGIKYISMNGMMIMMTQMIPLSWWWYHDDIIIVIMMIIMLMITVTKMMMMMMKYLPRSQSKRNCSASWGSSARRTLKTWSACPGQLEDVEEDDADTAPIEKNWSCHVYAQKSLLIFFTMENYNEDKDWGWW